MLTCDEILIEASIEEAEIEDGYFTENLKFIIDRDIDDEIDERMNSIFNSDSDTSVFTIIGDIENDLREDISNSGSEYANIMTAPTPEEDDVRCDNYFKSGLRGNFEWCDEDENSDYEFPNQDTGDYNPGYDSIFGA